MSLFIVFKNFAMIVFMLADIDKDTVDHQLNFDDDLKEPKVLPTRI